MRKKYTTPRHRKRRSDWQNLITAEMIRLRRTSAGAAAFHAFVLLSVFAFVNKIWPFSVTADHVSGFFNLTALRFKLFDSGPIPYFILWTFFFGLTYLLQVWAYKMDPISKGRITDYEILEAA